jgi:YVTN family beta-propeller protein
VYVTNSGANTVSVINTSNNTVVGSPIPVGSGPISLGNFVGGVITPTVTSISPTSGSTVGGTVITITGTNLTGATGITVGGTACTAFNVASATSATCTTPAGTPGAASVVVTTGGGSNVANTLFTYTAAPSSIPTLSEWAQLMLALMVIGVAWHFHNNRQNSY